MYVFVCVEGESSFLPSHDGYPMMCFAFRFSAYLITTKLFSLFITFMKIFWGGRQFGIQFYFPNICRHVLCVLPFISYSKLIIWAEDSRFNYINIFKALSRTLNEIFCMCQSARQWRIQQLLVQICDNALSIALFYHY